MAYLGTPSATKEIINKYSFAFQKKFGQNFLIDSNVLESIIRGAEITKDDFVLEIGPGIGTMTQYLCEAARQVVAVEIDKMLIPILEDTLSEYDNVEVINQDVLKVDIKSLAEEKNNGKPIKVVANLPYYITTPIIMGLFESGVPIGQHYNNGSKRSGGQNADRTGFKGLWGIVIGSSVLCHCKGYS